RDGETPLKPAKEYWIDGERAHIDALVIKFDPNFVQESDPLRGHSIALFTKIYGETQTPANGMPIDEPGQPLGAYRDEAQKVSSYEKELWANFWRLPYDDRYRTAMGVRVAQGEGVWGDFKKGYTYRLTVEANGGANLMPVKLPPVLEEYLRKKETNPP